MAADLADTPVTVNLLLPGGATDTGLVPDDTPAETHARLLDPAIMGPPIVWLASPAAAGIHDQRIITWSSRADPDRAAGPPFTARRSSRSRPPDAAGRRRRT